MYCFLLLIYSVVAIVSRPARPDWRDKAATARWMVHTIDYGVLSTISSRFVDENNNNNIPFGNVYSFVDGNNATGTPYFYGTFMDQSFTDMKFNPAASFTLTEASLLSSSAGKPPSSDDEKIRQACSVNYPSRWSAAGIPDRASGDAENPLCARLTLLGTLVQVPRDAPEFVWIQTNFWERHPQMRDWPVDHDWVIVKLVLQHIWLIDYYGGATTLDPDAYYGKPDMDHPGAGGSIRQSVDI
jgi:Pyridoxamine 5'-phosphate oxidase